MKNIDHNLRKLFFENLERAKLRHKCTKFDQNQKAKTARSSSLYIALSTIQNKYGDWDNGTAG